MLKFLNSTPARVVTILLVLQGAALYSSIRPEYIPSSTPLAQIPYRLGTWNFAKENVVDKEVQDILQADDLVNRTYTRAGVPAYFFVAAFRSQRTGKAPHSPKNCLPGSGWTPIDDREVSIDVGAGIPITVNRYIIEGGESRSLVLYWYQSRDRVIANEFEAKFWVIADAIRYNRTDTALVRVIVPIDAKNGFDEAAADDAATDFVRSFYAPLRNHLPS